MLRIQIFLSCFTQCIDILMNLLKHLKTHFKNDEIICIRNLLDVDVLDCFVINVLNYINCFDLFQIKVIFVHLKLFHYIEVSIFKSWIVVFDKNGRIEKLCWFLICKNEWWKEFSKFLSRSYVISFERRIFILFFHKHFFQFINLFFVPHYFF